MRAVCSRLNKPPQNCHLDRSAGSPANAPSCSLGCEHDGFIVMRPFGFTQDGETYSSLAQAIVSARATYLPNGAPSLNSPRVQAPTGRYIPAQGGGGWRALFARRVAATLGYGPIEFRAL